MEIVILLFRALSIIQLIVTVLVGILAIVGFFDVLRTRPDAYMVIDRKKENWLMMMGGASALALVSSYLSQSVGMLAIIAAVMVGIYWQDVRPSIRDVLGNASGSW